MTTKKKLLLGAAGTAAAAGAGVDVDDVFSTYVYDGTGSSRSITNYIDLSGEGGLVWTKHRNGASQHALFDTERGVLKGLASSSTSAEANETGSVTAFNSNGYTLGGWSGVNGASNTYVSWTFRKASKFFDVVTYTGNGVQGRTISHNLDHSVGMLMIKCTSHASDWSVQHRMVLPSKYLALNENHSAQNDSLRFHSTAAGTSTFSVGSANTVNGSGRTYVAYLFAHHNTGNPGEFGPDSDQNIVKCGSYTGNGSSTGPEINLGFEPQWVMVKNSSGTGGWQMMDVMRGMPVGDDDARLQADAADAEATPNFVNPQPTGFQVTSTGSNMNTNGATYIYMAIRRGPLAEPESATDVFATGVVQNNTGKTLTNPLGHPSDWAFTKTSSEGNWIVQSRMTGIADLKFDTSGAEVLNKGYGFANNTNYEADGTATVGAYGWNFRRAPSFFDVVAYTGNGASNRQISHNLGVQPEMIWIKCRSASDSWHVSTPSIWDDALFLNTNDAINTGVSGLSGANNLTATNFSVASGGACNGSGQTYIAFLFASLAGISKCGSYSGNGSTTGPIIDCGFSNGARFVLIKRTDSTGDWVLHDTERGITSGDDETLKLNSNAAETAGQVLNSHSSGFQLATADSFANASGGSYIFYAIA